MFLGRHSLVEVTGAGRPGEVPGRSRSEAEAASSRRNVYQELGIQPVLNFRGTHTVIGASKEWPELHEAMGEAARHFVVLDELQDKIGERLAKLIGSEDAHGHDWGSRGDHARNVCKSDGFR